MSQQIFTFRYLVLLTALLFASWVGAHMYYKSGMASANASQATNSITVTVNPQYDQLVDQALQYSLDGKYYEAANILIPLAQKDFSRAQLYLAVAYYHGHGVQRDLNKSKQLFFILQEKNYEQGIVNTYLNLLGSLPSV